MKNEENHSQYIKMFINSQKGSIGLLSTPLGDRLGEQ